MLSSKIMYNYYIILLNQNILYFIRIDAYILCGKKLINLINSNWLYIIPMQVPLREIQNKNPDFEMVFNMDKTDKGAKKRGKDSTMDHSKAVSNNIVLWAKDIFAGF